MKRWLVIALAVAGILTSAGLFYLYLQFNQKKVSSLESITPQETLVYYLYSYNPVQKIKEFQSSKFFRDFSASSVYLKFILPRFDEIKRKVPALPAVLNLLERDVALAIFPGSGEDIADLTDFLFLVRIRQKGKVEITRKIGDFYLSKVDKQNISYKKYKGIKITSYKLAQPQVSLSYAFLSDVIILANNSDIIKKSIDLFKGSSADSLLSSKDFQNSYGKVKKDSLFWGYVNTKNHYAEVLRRYTFNSLHAASPGTTTRPTDGFLKMKPFISLMNSLKGASFYLAYDQLKDGLVFKYYQGFDRAMDEEGMLNLIVNTTNLDKESLNLVPEDVVAYIGSSHDLLSYWRMMKKFYRSMEETMKAEMQSNPRYRQYQGQLDRFNVDSVFDKLDSFLGVNLEKDVLSLLGNNFGLVLVNIDDAVISFPAPEVNPNMPNQRVQKLPDIPIVFPKLYAFFALKDVPKIQLVMDNIVGHLVEQVNSNMSQSKRMAKERFMFPQQAAQTNAGQSVPQANLAPQVLAEEEKPFLQIQTDTYKDVKINTIDIAGFPLDFLRFNYGIVDKYLIFSFSPQLTKNIIDIYTAKKNSFDSNFSFAAIRSQMSADYSSLAFYDIKGLINNIKGLKLFNKFSETLGKGAQKKFSKDDLGSLLDTLSNFQSLTYTAGLLDPDTIEVSSYIKINGL